MTPLAGTIYTKLDAKNRLKIPARFGEFIRAYREIYFYRSIDGLCYLVTPLGWQSIVEELEMVKVSEFDHRASDIATYIHDSAMMLKVDSHGRITLPATVMETLAVSNEAELVIQARTDRLAIASKESYQAKIKEIQSNYKEIADEMVKRTLKNKGKKNKKKK